MRKGQQRTEEAKRRNAEAHLGKSFSDEHREKLSVAHQGKPRPPEVISRCVATRKARGGYGAEGIRAHRLKMGMHTVSDVDEEVKTGTCSVCGSVSVKSTSRGRGLPRTWRCRTACNARQNAYSKLPHVKTRERDNRYKTDTGALWDAQKGLCKLCGTPMTHARLSRDGACVDHNHSCCPGRKSCGKCVRGLVHRRCNMLLGACNEDVSILRLALSYLNAEPI